MWEGLTRFLFLGTVFLERSTASTNSCKPQEHNVQGDPADDIDGDEPQSHELAAEIAAKSQLTPYTMITRGAELHKAIRRASERLKTLTCWVLSH